MKTIVSINHAEAQELHEAVGLAFLMYGGSPLRRALELAALVVADTDPGRIEDSDVADA